ncbi:MAG: pyruvate dehydrogenase complex dihydrolipoamide acetyltransferase [Phycisphaerae bacterium]|nr:pyruvate dehydrogenase complex dihydrolipoamide acetyltransferase [Phycisphaerae bacterium]
MPIEITMPKLSDTMTTGTLVKWLKKEGDSVNPGDIIAEVETDKATQELEAFEPGTIAKIMVAEGSQIPIGGLIVVLAGPGEKVTDVAKAVAEAPRAAAPSATKPTAAAPSAAPAAAPSATAIASAIPAAVSAAAPAPAPAPAPVSGVAANTPSPAGQSASGKPRVSPLARKIAAEKGLDIGSVRGTGPGGRIIRRDVLEAPVGGTVAKMAGPPPKTKLQAGTLPLSNMRQTIARRLLESKQSIPHFYVSMDVVMDALLDLRRAVNEQFAPSKLSVTDFICRATAVAIANVPAVNASFSPTAIIRHGTVHLGVAVAVEDGLVVPVIRDAQLLSVFEISTRIRQLAELARSRKLKADQMTGGTFTISNLGMYGVREFQAIINPPEAAILAVGGTEPRPIVKNGQVVPGQVMSLSLSADHRVVDGAAAAEFLGELKTILENPLRMVL